MTSYCKHKPHQGQLKTNDQCTNEDNMTFQVYVLQRVVVANKL